MPPVSSTSTLTDDPRLWPVMETLEFYNHRPDALLEVLHSAQKSFGYLSPELLNFISRQLYLPPSRVQGVATFYHFFSFAPPGPHLCAICTGTACHMLGASCLLRALTPYRSMITTVRCVGACGLAPVALFDGKVIGQVREQQVIEWISRWYADEPNRIGTTDSA